MLKLNRQPRTNEDAETTRWYMQIAQAVNALVDKVTANDGPAFSAYPSAATSIPNITATKITMQTEEFDLGGYYDAANSRFQPLVAGIYQITVGSTLVSGTSNLPCILKNGSVYKFGTINTQDRVSMTALVQMNGTTDYVEAGCYQLSGSPKSTSAGYTDTYFQGVLVRLT